MCLAKNEKKKYDVVPVRFFLLEVSQQWDKCPGTIRRGLYRGQHTLLTGHLGFFLSFDYRIQMHVNDALFVCVTHIVFNGDFLLLGQTVFLGEHEVDDGIEDESSKGHGTLLRDLIIDARLGGWILTVCRVANR